MKVILFGASGYLGSHVAEQLLLAGHELICLLRPGADGEFLRSIGAKTYAINFSELHSAEQYIDERSVVINCIADTRSHASYAQRKPVEIDLTRDLFLLAQRRHALRFMQLSTVMVYGFSRPASAIDENFLASPTHIYSQVAFDRERALMTAYQTGGTELLILRPSNTLGKRDTSFLPSFVLASKFGIFPVVSGGDWAFSCIDARDVGRAMVHLLAVKISQTEVFLVKGFDVSWLSFKLELDSCMGKKTHILNMPKNIMYKLAAFFEWLVPYGRTPPLTRFDLDVLSTTTLFADGKIRATGFVPRYQLSDSFDDVYSLAIEER